MLPFFPRLLPDELVYSAIARLRARLRVAEHGRFEAFLVGHNQTTAVIDLPASISGLLTRIPGSVALQPQSLLWNHTLLPLHTAFSTMERATAAVDALLAGSGQGVHRLLNANARIPPTPEWLHFCPDCLAHDTEAYGHPYWHRLHQASGVTYCPIHERPLCRSCVPRSRRPNRHVFLTPSDACQTHAPQIGSELPSDKSRDLAHDISWVLENPTTGFRHGALAKEYARLATVAGYAKPAGGLALTRLEAEVVQHYGEPTLASLGVPFQRNRKSRSWIARLVRGDPTSFSALQHHLVIRFLGSTIPSFIATARTTSHSTHCGDKPRSNTA